ncbi:MAG: SUMF1/EgtB/PvdO family nonheme iron enzyme, partial [Tepidisphaeraceae bacterium]
LQDAYLGAPMAGVPRGTVKKLRVVAYHFAYQRIAGIDHRVGANGPWEVKRVLGTVDVEADGSACFRVPAKTPFTVQPLDAEGKAVQLMRSWMTAMPGETVSCAGCHDNRLAAPPVKQTAAMMRGPQTIKPWFGPPRGFSFKREVQPVVDKYCVGCHNGAAQPDGARPVDLRGEQGFFCCYKGEPKGEIIRGVPKEQFLGKYGGIFEPSYIELRRYVRAAGLESDLHGLPPMEFHADTSELLRMLKKGHHGVKLDAEAVERLATWIDLNAPCHGTWKELIKIGDKQCERRKELQKLYGGLVQDPEEIPDATPLLPLPPGEGRGAGLVRPNNDVTNSGPHPNHLPKGEGVKVAGWPFDSAEALRRQNALDRPRQSLDLGNGVKLELAHIPAGEFAMGDGRGSADERPRAAKIERAFWMGQFEVTNEQYAQFDPEHDSRFEHRTSWIFSEEYLGWPLNGPKQPVVRVSWYEAMEFCKWLSAKTGKRYTLPTEQQWEWACRAGTDTPFWFGDMNTDFSPFANLADKSIRELAYQGWRPKAPDIAARDDRFDDGHLVTADVGSYKPNLWGLYDMHGNAAEWTASTYNATQRVVRGGSWFDLPVRARSAARWGYEPWQKVFNVGFRVVCDDGP